MASKFAGLLPPDDVLHQRESQWLRLIEKYEQIGDKFADIPEEQLDGKLAKNLTDESESSDEENASPDDQEMESEEEAADYGEFREMLSGVRKAVIERKKIWEETGDSFIIDHFSENTRVYDWVKENIDEERQDSGGANLDISTIYSDICKRKKKTKDLVSAVPKKRLTKSQSVEPVTPKKKPQQSLLKKSQTPSTRSVIKDKRIPETIAEEFVDHRHSTGAIKKTTTKRPSPDNDTISSTDRNRKNRYSESMMECRENGNESFTNGLQSTLLVNKSSPERFVKSRSVEPSSPVRAYLQPRNAVTPSCRTIEDKRFSSQRRDENTSRSLSSLNSRSIIIQRTPSSSYKDRRRDKLGGTLKRSQSVTPSGSFPLANSKYRHLLQKEPRRLSIVPESPSVEERKKEPRRKTVNGPPEWPRERMIIYSPMAPQVDKRFKYLLLRPNFDPSKTLVYEPPHDVSLTSDSDDDILRSLKKKNGGKIYEI